MHMSADHNVLALPTHVYMHSDARWAQGYPLQGFLLLHAEPACRGSIPDEATASFLRVFVYDVLTHSHQEPSHCSALEQHSLVSGELEAMLWLPAGTSHHCGR